MDRSNLNDRSASWLSSAIVLVSIGAMLWTDSPARGAELAARNEASPPAAGETEKSSTAATAALVGIEEQGAVGLLGRPTATESRAPADVWKYTSSRCELELVFYMEMRTGRMRALHYAFKGEAENDAQRQACLTAIQQNSLGRTEDKPEREVPESKVAVELPSEKDPVPLSEPGQPPGRHSARNRPAPARRYVRWYDSRPVWNGGRGYTLALRYPNFSSLRASRTDPTSNYAAATRGWGGGLFGPAPYSASGPQ